MSSAAAASPVPSQLAQSLNQQQMETLTSTRPEAEMNELESHAADLLGLSMSPLSLSSSLPQHQSMMSAVAGMGTPVTKESIGPAPIPIGGTAMVKRSSRRGSDVSTVGGIEKKKLGITTNGRRYSENKKGMQPTLFDFRSIDSPPPMSRSFTNSVNTMGIVPSSLPNRASIADDGEVVPGDGEDGEITAKSGKRRGQVYRCETCSKMYRHPSCLVKHRWQHTKHWNVLSGSMLSKHQQVQVLEAAAILSYLHPSAEGKSLPDDRALWPSTVSTTAPEDDPEPLEPLENMDPNVKLHKKDAAREQSLTRSSPPVAGGSESSSGSGNEGDSGYASQPSSFKRSPSFIPSLPLHQQQQATSTPSTIVQQLPVARSPQISSLAPIPVRRPSFNSPAFMGQMGIVASMPDTQHRHQFSPYHHSYENSYGTSPSLRIGSSSLRGGVEEEDDDDDEEEDKRMVDVTKNAPGGSLQAGTWDEEMDMEL